MSENRKSETGGKTLQVRNSTIDFLVFTRDAHEDGIEGYWTKNIFENEELEEDTVCAKFAQTADDGKNYQYKFYALSAIIAVGYRINSGRATQFRQWATKVLASYNQDEEMNFTVHEH